MDLITNQKINKAFSLLKTENYSELIKLIDELKNEKKTKIVSLFLMGILNIKKNEPYLAKKNFYKILEKKKRSSRSKFKFGTYFF